MAGERSYHNASIELGESEATWLDESGIRYIAAIPVEDYEGDPCWPTVCACGYEFQPEDKWQVNQEPVYAGEGHEQVWTNPSHRRQPTPGAMFDTFWRTDLRKEDNLAISVVCPNGAVWCIDDRASSGGFWTRTGRPPKLTVQPSIVAGDYHGFLKSGILTASI